MLSSLLKNTGACLLGLLLSTFSIEIIARIAPATDVSPLVKPIVCETDPKIEFKFNLECFHRKSPHTVATFSQGRFRPNINISTKTTNDIGQFSDVNFSELLRKDNKSVAFFAIGDSFVEAVQVNNSDSYHGRLNNYTLNGKKIISSSLGGFGMALPNYLAYFRFLLEMNLSKDDFVIISIISNDFDESFMKYGLKGRRGGQGQFFFDEINEKLIFKEWESVESAKDILMEFILTNFASARFFIYNLELGNVLTRLDFFRFTDKSDYKKQKYVANILNSNRFEDPTRFQYGKKAVDIFLSQLSISAKEKHDVNKIVFVVDCDRESIYQGQQADSDGFFEVMREYFISASQDHGFKTIDMCIDFLSDYNANGLRFNSLNDGHWNSHGHQVVAQTIANLLSLKIIKN